MPAAEIDVKYVAHLARLALTADEERTLPEQLRSILGYVEKLNELDVSEVEPMAHAVVLRNVMRPDQVHRPLAHEEAMHNAPEKGNGLFLVPKIVE